jgi:hypothetical protein
MHLDLWDEETAALIKELHDLVENDRYPFSPVHPHAEGHSRQAQTRARPRTLCRRRRCMLRREPPGRDGAGPAGRIERFYR